MAADLARLYQVLNARAEAYGIAFGEKRLKADEPGQFDGLSITMNSEYDPEERAYYLAHAIGSIAQWSLKPQHSQAVFDELHAAEAKKEQDPDRLERAIQAHLQFETVSSEHAVWLLADVGFGDLIPSYTNFARADMESIAQLHRRGEAPVWRDFFAQWNRDVAGGRRKVPALQPRPIPPFRPVPIRTQEIVQEND